MNREAALTMKQDGRRAVGIANGEIRIKKSPTLERLFAAK